MIITVTSERKSVVNRPRTSSSYNAQIRALQSDAERVTSPNTRALIEERLQELRRIQHYEALPDDLADVYDEMLLWAQDYAHRRGREIPVSLAYEEGAHGIATNTYAYLGDDWRVAYNFLKEEYDRHHRHQ